MLKRSLCVCLPCLSLIVACGGSEDASGTDDGLTNDMMNVDDDPNPMTDPTSMGPGNTPPGAMPGGVEPSPEPGASTPVAEPAPAAEPTDSPEPAPEMEPGPAGEPEMVAEPTMEPGPGVEPEMVAEPTMEPEMVAEPTMEPEMVAEPTMEPESPPTGDCAVWMAPDGDDAGDGTEASPVASLLIAYDLLCPKPPDGTPNGTECLRDTTRTICAKPGTYTETERLEFKKTRMGSASNRIVLQGDPNSSERPVFDFSTQDRLSCGANPDNIGGLTVNAHYVTVRNIVVTGANDNCILMQGTEGLIENVLTYECADTGIQISSGGEYEGTGTNNTVLNCDSHSNNDVQCDGENADGFAIKEGTGTGNEFIGCRAWNNADDGYDLYAWTSTVLIENSWAFDQCATTLGGGSDCNGFKLGGDDVSATHTLVDLVAVGNSRGTGNGFTENSNPANLSCSGTCASWGNSVDVDSVSGVSTSPIGNANITNMAADGARNADGSLKSPSSL